MHEGTFPPYYSMPKEAGLRAVDYVNPVHNHAPVGACLAADGHIIHETRDSTDNDLEELMARIRKNKAAYLADQAAIRSFASKLIRGYASSDEEEMPGLEPDSDDEEENNSSESGDDDEDSGPDEEENIPDMGPENEEKAADEIAKALKGYLDNSEEGTLRYTSSDVSTVQEGDPRDPSMYQLQRRINGEEGSYRYISFQPLPQDLDERRTMNKAYLLNHKAAFDPAHFVSITMDGLEMIFKGIYD
jgi:hypothetical protein